MKDIVKDMFSGAWETKQGFAEIVQPETHTLARDWPGGAKLKIEVTFFGPFVTMEFQVTGALQMHKKLVFKGNPAADRVAERERFMASVENSFLCDPGFLHFLKSTSTQ